MGIDSNLATTIKTPVAKTPPVRALLAMSATRWLVVILAIATLLRLGSALYQGNTVTNLPGIYDQISYDGLARRVVAGHGFSFAEGHWPATRAGEPTAHWSYLYTLFLAGVYAIFGSQPVAARTIQALLVGILQPWLTWRIGRRLFSPPVGLIAAGLCAIYVYFFYYAGALLTEMFYIVGILWTLDVALRISARGRQSRVRVGSSKVGWRLWLELGLALGVTVLFRQVFLLFVPVLFAWLWWNLPERSAVSSVSTHWRRRVRWPAVTGLVSSAVLIALLIAPWTVRNYCAFDTFVPLNTNAGFAFFWGNHPIYGTRFVGLLPSDGPSYVDLIPAELRHLNEAELDKALLQRGIGFVLDDPVRFVLLSASRSVEYFKFWPSAGSGAISNLSRVASFGILLPFMIYGLWLSWRLLWNSRDELQRMGIVLLYLFITVYSGVHLISWALVRYRVPVDAILLLFAALAFEKLGTWLIMPHRNTVRQNPIQE